MYLRPHDAQLDESVAVISRDLPGVEPRSLDSHWTKTPWPGVLETDPKL
jgi:hypothetical protein